MKKSYCLQLLKETYQKYKQMNNKDNKCPVIKPRSFRKVFSFFNWVLLY